MKTGLRERKQIATRSSIWHTAMELFAEHGYDQVTIEEIAEQCQLSPRTVFRYFGTKEEVLFAGTELRHALLLAAIRSQSPDGDCFSTLQGAIRVLATGYLPELELFKNRAQIVEGAPSLQRRNAALNKQWDQDVIDLLHECGYTFGLTELELRLIVGCSMTALRVSIEAWIADEGELTELIDAAFGQLAAGMSRPRSRSRR